MDELLEGLRQIENILEQIEDITENQTTVLLSSRHKYEEKHITIDMMNQMIDIKEGLMNDLQKIEIQFQENYTKRKKKLTNKEVVNTLQVRVSDVLKRKQNIVEREQGNLVIMQSQTKARKIPLRVQPNAETVVNTYKKHQLKT